MGLCERLMGGVADRTEMQTGGKTRANVGPVWE